MCFDCSSELRDLAEQAAAELLRLSPDVAARRPAQGKWSIKEIVGHLIDSASNNHQRFVQAQWTSDLVFPGYDQDAWVSSQRYADAPWVDLVMQWREFNRHLAWTIAALAPDTRERQRHPHNLDQIAFRAVPADEPVTLDYFIHDYLDHLEHHLQQIDRIVSADAEIEGDP